MAALVRAKAASQASPAAADRATSLRQSMKRLTDAYVYGAMAEADYRTELAALKDGSQIAKLLRTRESLERRVRVLRRTTESGTGERPPFPKQAAGRSSGRMVFAI